MLSIPPATTIRISQNHCLRRQHDGFKAGSAHLIDSHAFDGRWKSGEDRRLPGRSLSHTRLEEVSHDHLLHVSAADPRATYSLFDNDCAEPGCRDGPERSAKTTDRSSACTDYHCFVKRHDDSPPEKCDKALIVSVCRDRSIPSIARKRQTINTAGKGLTPLSSLCPITFTGRPLYTFPSSGGENAEQVPSSIENQITPFNTPRKDTVMLYTIAVVLLVLWLLGLVTSYTLGGFIHIFLLVALVVLVFSLISGRRRAA